MHGVQATVPLEAIGQRTVSSIRPNLRELIVEKRPKPFEDYPNSPDGRVESLMVLVGEWMVCHYPSMFHPS
jgi:hypothetical protein